MSRLLRAFSTCVICHVTSPDPDESAEGLDRFRTQIAVVRPLAAVVERPVTCCLFSVVSIRSKMVVEKGCCITVLDPAMPALLPDHPPVWQIQQVHSSCLISRRPTPLLCTVASAVHHQSRMQYAPPLLLPCHRVPTHTKKSNVAAPAST